MAEFVSLATPNPDFTTASAQELADWCFSGALNWRGEPEYPFSLIERLLTVACDGYQKHSDEMRARLRGAASIAEVRLGESYITAKYRWAQECHDRGAARLAPLSLATGATGQPYFEEVN